jgi:uncharacterized RDD family membrane protein YckC
MIASSAESARGSTFAGRTAQSNPVPEPSPATAFAAGFVSRAVAMAIDLLVITAIVLTSTLVTELVSAVLPRWVWLNAAIAAVVGAVVSFVPLFYFSVAVAITGRTVGKAVMGIRVLGLDGRQLSAGRSLVRTIAYVFSLLPLFGGFLWVLVDRDRRGWHDHIARSRVVHEPRASRV